MYDLWHVMQKWFTIHKPDSRSRHGDVGVHDDTARNRNKRSRERHSAVWFKRFCWRLCGSRLACARVSVCTESHSSTHQKSLRQIASIYVWGSIRHTCTNINPKKESLANLRAHTNTHADTFWRRKKNVMTEMWVCVRQARASCVQRAWITLCKLVAQRGRRTRTELLQ